MHSLIWIFLAFVVGVIFGRMLQPSNGATAPAPRANPVPLIVVGDPSGAYQLTLVDRGGNIINTIKAVRSVTKFGLKDAKDLVEAAPIALIRVTSADQADAIRRLFEGVATVRVDGPAGSTHPTN